MADTRPCEVCGDAFNVPPRRLDTARFCSRKCKGIASRKSFACEVCGAMVVHAYRSRSKRWCSKACAGVARRTGSMRECPVCGKTVYRPRSYTYRAFCGKVCADAFQTYAPERMFYGSRWIAQRLAALRRDGWSCQGCGAKKKGRRSLHVHHVIPFKSFRTQTEANALDNLVTLCPSCHKRADVAYHSRGEILWTPHDAGSENSES